MPPESCRLSKDTDRRILLGLARRGFLRAREATSGSRSGRKPELIDLSELQRPAGRSQPSFVSACSLRNLPVLNQLYGDALGDLAMDVLRAVVEEVLAESDPGASVARAHGPEIVIRHDSTSRDEIAAVVRRLHDVAAAVALPAGGTSVPLRPVVASVGLAASSAWSADDVQRTLHEALALAGRSEEGFVLRGPEESEQTLRLLRNRDARLARVTRRSRGGSRGALPAGHRPHQRPAAGRRSPARIRASEGLLVAAEFIDVVHDLGETAALDSHVMRRVGEEAHRLALASARLFVNVSAALARLARLSRDHGGDDRPAP
jgi:GGDEF domain-containing protein